MSIYSSPFPSQGTDECPTVTVAQTIARCAYVIDGESAIAEIAGYVELKQVGDHTMPEIKAGSRIAELRRPIAKVWDNMSDKAKALFFKGQYDAAVDYRNDCVENIRNELGDIDIEAKLPTSNGLLAKWLS
jgi:hypothetical protein